MEKVIDNSQPIFKEKRKESNWGDPATVNYLVGLM
jgi:hypothetical protein